LLSAAEPPDIHHSSDITIRGEAVFICGTVMHGMMEANDEQYKPEIMALCDAAGHT